jgi:hypothetical protein
LARKATPPTSNWRECGQIKLPGLVLHRLRENAEVIGSDEAFIKDDMGKKSILDLYNEKSGILEEPGKEVDDSGVR